MPPFVVLLAVARAVPPAALSVIGLLEEHVLDSPRTVKASKPSRVTLQSNFVFSMLLKPIPSPIRKITFLHCEMSVLGSPQRPKRLKKAMNIAVTKAIKELKNDMKKSVLSDRK